MRSPLGRVPPTALALVATLVAGGCRPAGSAPASRSLLGDGEGTGLGSGSGSVLDSDKSLYVRLGGVDGIRAVVDEMVSRAAADPRIQQFFVDTDFRRLKSQLVVQLCELSGGPCRYRGRPMAQVHRRRNIQPQHFEAMIEDMRDALKAARVGERERHEFLAILRGLKPDIVGRAAEAEPEAEP